MNDYDINPKTPYLIQRIELSGDSRYVNGRKHKVDYRKLSKVLGDVPDKYDGQACENAEEMQKIRRTFMKYDNMGSAEFEFGALPRAYWKFLHAFKSGNGHVERVDMWGGVNGDTEKFWIFAPNSTMQVAKDFLLHVCNGVYQNGVARMHLKEGLRFDRALFPNLKSLDGRPRDSYVVNERLNNEMNYCGWFDLDNSYFIFWDRPDIAQAFSVIHGFGDVRGLESKVIDIREGCKKETAAVHN